ncbi:hypothetical protein [Francisella salimarina]|uniref:hypothetical protein n=1 Tax=Francisella salimarina TaxID=2599927 RepID=UPI0037510C23
MKKITGFIICISTATSLYANNHFCEVNNQMEFRELHSCALNAYTNENNNKVKGNESLIIYNSDTNIAFKFDNRVYFKEVGRKTDDNLDYEDLASYKFHKLTNENYANVDGKNQNYTKETIMNSFMAKGYFNGANFKSKFADEHVRSIALLAEAIRFTSYYKELVYNDGSATKNPWSQSWEVLAHNWANITNDTFNIPASEYQIREWVRNRATEDQRNRYIKHFASPII